MDALNVPLLGFVCLDLDEDWKLKPSPVSLSTTAGKLINVVMEAFNLRRKERDTELEFKSKVDECASQRKRVNEREEEKTSVILPFTDTVHISEYLRYFPVQNRSDGTTTIQVRQINLRRNLVDASSGMDLSREEDRVQTFRAWRFDAIVTRHELAGAGFKYLGDGDRVQCVFCKGILRDWRQADRALTEHRKHFPTCPFLLRVEVGNQAVSRPKDYSCLPSVCTQPSPNRARPTLPDCDPVLSVTATARRECEQQAVHPHMSRLQTLVDSFRHHARLPTWPVFAAASEGFFRDPDSCADSVDGGGVTVVCYGCDLRLDFVSVQPNTSSSWRQRHSGRSCPHRRMYGGATRPEMKRSRGFRHRVETRQVRALLDLPEYQTLLRHCNEVDTQESRALLLFVLSEQLEKCGRELSVLEARPKLAACIEEFREAVKEHPYLSVDKFVCAKEEEKERAKEERRIRNEELLAAKAEKLSLNSCDEVGSMNHEELEVFNRQLKDMRTCKICMDNMVDTLVFPCCHFILCHDCAPKLKTCAVCRVTIQSTILTVP